MDRLLFEFFHQYAGQWKWLDAIAVFMSGNAGYVLLFVFALILFKAAKTRWPLLFCAVLAILFSRLMLTEIIRFLWERPRPFVEPSFTPLIQHAASSSFPSGHAALYFALSAVVFAYHKKIGILFFVVSFAIGLARIFAGLHWPSDIIGGALIGIVSGFAVVEFSKRRKEKSGSAA